MNETPVEVLSIVVERDIAHPPEKIWRALTQPHLISEWLMKNNFEPVVGHRFKLSADWGAVECRVETLKPFKSLSYTWDTKDLTSVVTWTLTPTRTGTHLHMKQTGFKPEQKSYYQGATIGWPRFIAALEQVLTKIDQEGKK